MNREQIQKDYLNLLKWKIDEEDKIIEAAKKAGNWKRGLDSNEELFAELEKEFAEKVKKLKGGRNG